MSTWLWRGSRLGKFAHLTPKIALNCPSLVIILILPIKIVHCRLNGGQPIGISGVWDASYRTAL